MIADRILKLKLLEYFLGKFWYAHLEVDVQSKQRLSKTRKLLTDIDVLGMYPDVTGHFKFVLGDCKTLKNQSPISRSFWMKGLMEYFDADHGFVVLQKYMEKDHQFTSAQLGIQLLSERDFDTYALHTSKPTQKGKSAIANLDHWDKFLDISVKFPKLQPLMTFSKVDFWNERAYSTSLRRALIELKTCRRELNPTNLLHQSIVLNHLSLMAIALNDIIVKIFNWYLLPKDKQELDEDLKAILWGGVENYQLLNDFRRKISPQIGLENELALPQWSMFLEFIRSCLQNPLSFNYVPLFLKEHGFMLLADGTMTYDYSQSIAAHNPYIVTYSIKLMEYVVKACDMQAEFIEIFSNRFLDLDGQDAETQSGVTT